MYVIDEIDFFSYSDRENSDIENSDKENYNVEENFDKEN